MRGFACYETLHSQFAVRILQGAKTYSVITQDIYSTIYLSNLVRRYLNIRFRKRELIQRKKRNRKHKMMINQTVSIGILKMI